MDILEAFTKIGFTRQEASLYITLCKEGDLTGYETAKYAGISRSNAYLALAGLVDKGAAFRIDGEAVKYSAVAFSELEKNILRQNVDLLKYIEQHIPEREEPKEAYITIAGMKNIINKMKNIVSTASHRIYVSMSESDMKDLKAELLIAISKGLKVVVITSPNFLIEGATIYNVEKPEGEIRIIADSSEVLTGKLDKTDNCTCLYSKNPNLVQLIKESLKNEIKLIELSK